MNIGEKLRKIINDNIDNARPFFAYVVEQNEDFSWQVQPVDQQPLIYNAMTFQEEEDGNKPEIGSLVLCIYIDQMSCFITEIISYDTFFMNTKTNSTLFSERDTVVVGKRLIMAGQETTPQQIKDYIDNLPETETELVAINSKNVKIDSEEFLLIKLKDGRISMYDDGLINIDTKKDIFLTADKDIIIRSKNDLNMISQNKILLSSDKGMTILANDITLNSILQQLSITLAALQAAAGNIVPPLPNVPQLINDITTFNQP